MTLVRSVFIAAGVVALGLKGARGRGASRVVALSACPSAASGCIEMVAHWDFARTDRPPFVDARRRRHACCEGQGAVAARGACVRSSLPFRRRRRRAATILARLPISGGRATGGRSSSPIKDRSRSRRAGCMWGVPGGRRLSTSVRARWCNRFWAGSTAAPMLCGGPGRIDAAEQKRGVFVAAAVAARRVERGGGLQRSACPARGTQIQRTLDRGDRSRTRRGPGDDPQIAASNARIRRRAVACESRAARRTSPRRNTVEPTEIRSTRREIELDAEKAVWTSQFVCEQSAGHDFYRPNIGQRTLEFVGGEQLL